MFCLKYFQYKEIVLRYFIAKSDSDGSRRKYYLCKHCPGNARIYTNERNSGDTLLAHLRKKHLNLHQEHLKNKGKIKCNRKY